MFDCFSGISGDMIISALCDLFGCTQKIIQKIQSINIPYVRFFFEQVKKKSIVARSIRVIVDDNKDLAHRKLEDIYEILDGLNVSNKIKNKARKIFLNIAEAEAYIHQKDVKKIHFHEVGSIDAVFDVVTSLFLIE